MPNNLIKNMKNKDLKVSVIIISLNFGNYIEKTINAILGQDYPNIEVIVVDGNSTDETVKVLKKFDSKIIWISEPDKGQGDAVLKGIFMSTGDIITIQSADDLLCPGSIANAVETIKRNPGVAGIYGGYTRINEDGKDVTDKETTEVIREQMSDKNSRYIQYLYKNFKGKRKTAKYSFKDLVTRKIVLPACATFFRKDILYRCNFRDLKKLPTCPDYRLWLEMGLHAPFIPIQDNLSKSRIQLGGGNVNPKNIERFQQSYETTVEWFFNNPKVPDEYKTRSIQRKLRLRILLVKTAVRANVSYKKSIDEYLKIVRKNPDVIFYWPKHFRYFLWNVKKYHIMKI